MSKQRGKQRGSGRPTSGYRLADGTRVPSVTTILGRFKESGGLLYWAWQQGRDGLDLNAARDKAAEIGTIVHAMVEADIHGTTCDIDAGEIPGGAELVESAFSAYLKWRKASKVTITHTEMPLVSEEHRYGGTLDCVGSVGGEGPCVIDWKTSNAIYTDHLLQMAAYGDLYTEVTGEPIVGYHLLRFSKSGSFHHHHFPSLAPALEQFHLLRQAYALEKQVKGLL